MKLFTLKFLYFNYLIRYFLLLFSELVADTLFKKDVIDVLKRPADSGRTKTEVQMVMQFLENVSFLQHLEPEDVFNICSKITLSTFAADEYVFEPDELADAVYIILDGKVEILAPRSAFHAFDVHMLTFYLFLHCQKKKKKKIVISLLFFILFSFFLRFQSIINDTGSAPPEHSGSFAKNVGNWLLGTRNGNDDPLEASENAQLASAIRTYTMNADSSDKPSPSSPSNGSGGGPNSSPSNNRNPNGAFFPNPSRRNSLSANRGQLRVAATLGSGNVFGERSVLECGTRNSAAHCIEESEILVRYSAK